MKATTLKKRLANRYNGSKATIAYKIVNAVIEDTWAQGYNGKGLIRPVHTSGSKRFTTNLDYTRDTEQLLKLIGVKYESGNDAPRGGLTGNYIKILTKIER